jgi:RNA polymerase sigma factor (sigma-70 family)
MTATPHPSPVVTVAQPLLRELHAQSGAGRWDVSFDAFAARVRIAVAKRFGDAAVPVREVESFVRTLHVEDLSLAIACTAGHGAAWDHFVLELRPALYAAGRSIAGEGGRELADSLLAELYGVDTRGEQRRSLLEYYHGRSRLATWLRTVLSQRHVDQWRATSRTVALDEESPREMPAPPTETDPHRREYVASVQRALDESLAALDARDRLRLRMYYGRGLKLAQIGKILSEHEATVSRKLDRTRGDIRKELQRRLSERGLSPDAVRECLRQAAEAPELDISRALAGDSGELDMRAGKKQE